MNFRRVRGIARILELAHLIALRKDHIVLTIHPTNTKTEDMAMWLQTKATDTVMYINPMVVLILLVLMEAMEGS